jgi:predicted Rossmann fold nucleotide-binding protein DprA/Smf involved in DNA uptake
MPCQTVSQPELWQAAATVPTPEKKVFCNDFEETICKALLTNGPGTLDDLAKITDLPPGVLAGTLMALEIRDYVTQTPNGIYALK